MAQGLDVTRIHSNTTSPKMFGTNIDRSIDILEKQFDEKRRSIIMQSYNPMNLAAEICNHFGNYPDALVTSFIDDLIMFEYLYEFLPKNIAVGVLNKIPLTIAIDIVRKYHSSTFVYDQIDPILYVIRFLSESMLKDPMARDPHCIEFNYNVIPNNAKLDFVLRSKNYLNKNEFQNLVKILSE